MKLVALVCLLVTFSATSNSITTCLDYTPFEMDGKGQKQWSGPNTETLYLVAEQAGLQLDTSRRAPFARCLELLKSGQIDILPGLIYTEQRARSMHLVPYSSRNQLVIFHLKDASPPPDPQQPFRDQVVGVHRVFALPDSVKASSLKRHLMPVTSVDVGFEMTLKGRLDGMLVTLPTGINILKSWPEIRDKFTYVPLPMDKDMQICFGISLQSELANDIKKIQVAIAVLANNGNLEHLHITPAL